MPNLPVPIPANGVAGVDVSAAFWNAQVRDSTAFLLNPPHCVMYQTVAQAVASGTFTPITFDTSEVDSYSGHSTSVNTSQYVAQVGGWYQCSGVVVFVAHSDVLKREATWAKNGTLVIASTGGGPNVNDVNGVVPPTREIFLNIGDFVTLVGEQSSGVSVSTNVGTVASMATIRWVHA